MTDQANATSTDTSQPGTNSPNSTDAGTGAASGAGAAPEPKWYETLADEGMRSNPRLQRLGSVDDLAKSLVNAEARLGLPEDHIIRLPTDPNDKDAYKAIFQRLGAPADAKGYDLKLDDKATDQDKALLGGFLEMAAAANMPKGMAEAALAWWNEQTVKAVEARDAAIKEGAEQTRALLQKEWGAAFEPTMNEIVRLLGADKSPEMQAELDRLGLGNSPLLLRALKSMTDRMAEPGAPGGVGERPASMDGKLTPAQANAELNKKNADAVWSRALKDKNDPAHAETLKDRRRLLAWADGREAE